MPQRSDGKCVYSVSMYCMWQLGIVMEYSIFIIQSSGKKWMFLFISSFLSWVFLSLTDTNILESKHISTILLCLCSGFLSS